VIRKNKGTGHLSQGFTAVEVAIAVLVVMALGLGGWWVWERGQQNRDTKESSKSQNQGSNSSDRADPHRDWVQYENAELGIGLAHPEDWEIGSPRVIKTTLNESGWVVSLTVKNAKKGDPAVNLSIYPARTSIKDVDATKTDVKVQDVRIADNQNLTLVGVLAEPSSVSEPTSMYFSSCWPRNCTPILENGDFLSLDVGAVDNDCSSQGGCNTAINQDSENYATLLEILSTIKSL